MARRTDHSGELSGPGSVKFTVRLSADDHGILRRAADRAGYTGEGGSPGLATWLRHMALDACASGWRMKGKRT